MPLITRRSPAIVHRLILSPTTEPMKTRDINGTDNSMNIQTPDAGDLSADGSIFSFHSNML